MPVYLSTATLGNAQTLLTMGGAGEIMGWFYPHKDHAQNIYQCLPCVYLGDANHGSLHWTWGEEWEKHQAYVGDSNILLTRLRAQSLGIELEFIDLIPEAGATLMRQINVRNFGESGVRVGSYLYGDWNLGGIRTGNNVIFSRGSGLLVQSHREAAVAIGGDALQAWQCGKAGKEWANNAQYALRDGVLHCQDLEIGDVNWAFGFNVWLDAGQSVSKTAIFAMGRGQQAATDGFYQANEMSFEEHRQAREKADAAWLSPGLQALKAAGGSVPAELEAAYKRSLLCLPLLLGEEGVAVAAPEFDPEFLSCGGYGYTWPRDGGEYVSGLLDAGYPEMAEQFFDWSARHQDVSGLWHQRYFLNGEPGPNWCLPPDMLQIDQVGAVVWAFGKWKAASGKQEAVKPEHAEMIRRAADYLLGRLTDKGVHGNAFDTWETFVGSFSYSNASIYAAFKVAHQVLGDTKYDEGAQRVKAGVLTHFVRDYGYPFLTRGFNGGGDADTTVDSASLGAIEPFGLLDLNDDNDLRLAEGTLQAMRDRLEVDWEGGRAIRRFEGDAYVGGVPACVNTLWMARCSLHVAARLRALGRIEDANELTNRAQTYLATVLRRATPTGLLPELMQGPTGQKYWAAPHGWAMSSFVSGVLMLAKQKAG